MKLVVVKNQKNFRKGFTLVEMIVVLGLFSFIMTLATSVLYTTQAVNVKLQATQAVIDNVNVSVETMVRDIRYGSDFRCLDSFPDTSDTTYQQRRNCSYSDNVDPHGGNVLFFKPIDAATSTDRIVYYATTSDSGAMVIKKGEYYYGKPVVTYQITSDDVKVKSLIFYVTGASSTIPQKDGLGAIIPNSFDYKQPLVTFSFSGETVPAKDGATTTPFLVETSVASRVLDN